MNSATTLGLYALSASIQNDSKERCKPLKTPTAENYESSSSTSYILN